MKLNHNHCVLHLLSNWCQMDHTSIKHPTAGECEDLKRSLMGHKSVNIFEEVPWKKWKANQRKGKESTPNKVADFLWKHIYTKWRYWSEYWRWILIAQALKSFCHFKWWKNIYEHFSQVCLFFSIIHVIIRQISIWGSYMVAFKVKVSLHPLDGL